MWWKVLVSGVGIAAQQSRTSQPRRVAMTMLKGLRGTRRWALLAALGGALAAPVIPAQAEALQPGCVQSGTTVTCTYTSGSNAFTVPDGVSSVHVEAVGGRGGTSAGSQAGAGGHGARVVGDLTVSAGSTLFAVVGGNGGGRAFPLFFDGGVGGYNGGGTGGIPFGAGGGGASDVRLQGADLASRVLVAGGGGGGGQARPPGIGPLPGGQGGNGGDAGAAGGNGGRGGENGGGGGAGTATAGGAGGTGGIDPVANGLTGAFAGSPGSFGTGGDGNLNGGGGGGGVFGGGGGGMGLGINEGGGGGGGGSSLVPAGGSVSIDTTGMPKIVISYSTAP